MQYKRIFYIIYLYLSYLRLKKCLLFLLGGLRLQLSRNGDKKKKCYQPGGERNEGAEGVGRIVGEARSLSAWSRVHPLHDKRTTSARGARLRGGCVTGVFDVRPRSSESGERLDGGIWREIAEDDSGRETRETRTREETKSTRQRTKGLTRERYRVTVARTAGDQPLNTRRSSCHARFMRRQRNHTSTRNSPYLAHLPHTSNFHPGEYSQGRGPYSLLLRDRKIRRTSFFSYLRRVNFINFNNPCDDTSDVVGDVNRGQICYFRGWASANWMRQTRRLCQANRPFHDRRDQIWRNKR